MASSKSENYYNKQLEQALEAFCAFWKTPLEELLADEKLLDIKALTALSIRLASLTTSEIKSFTKILTQNQEKFPFSPKTFLLLGHQQYAGIGVPADNDKAFELYERAGDHPAALHYKGLISFTKKLYGTALTYYQQAADKGYPSKAEIAIFHYNRHIPNTNRERGHELLQNAVEKDRNEPVTNYYLGIIYRLKKNTESGLDNTFSSYSYFLASLKNGYIPALFEISYLLDRNTKSSVLNNEKGKLECWFLDTILGRKESLSKLIDHYGSFGIQINLLQYSQKLKALYELKFTPDIKERLRTALTYAFDKIAFDYHMAVLTNDVSFMISLFKESANHSSLEKQFLQWDIQEAIKSNHFWLKVINKLIQENINLPPKLSDLFCSIVCSKLFLSGKPDDLQKAADLAEKISDLNNVPHEICWLIGTALHPYIKDQASFDYVYGFLRRGAELEDNKDFFRMHFDKTFDTFKIAELNPKFESVSQFDVFKANMFNTVSRSLQSLSKVPTTISGAISNNNNETSNENGNTTKYSITPKLIKSLANGFSKWSGISDKQSKTSEPSVQSQTIPEQEPSQEDVMHENEPRSDSSLDNN